MKHETNFPYVASQHVPPIRRLARRTGRVHALPCALVVLSLSALALSGCRRGGNAPPAGGKATPAAQQASQAILVSTTPARTGSISDIAIVTGSLGALNDVTVGTKSGGKIVAVYVREGDVVRVGQPVAQQDPADLQNQLNSQRANLDTAQANLETARTRLDQSRVAYKNAQTNLTLTDAQTKSAVAQAKAALDVARQQGLIVQRGARAQERSQAVDNVSSAKADRDKARADLKRYQDLYRQQAVAAQQLDQAQAAADSADARYNSSTAALSLIQEGSRPEDIRRAQASVEQANQALLTAQANRDQVELRRADVNTAQSQIQTAQAGVRQAQAGVRQAQSAVALAQQAENDAVIRSPIAGVVAERKVEPGQQMAAAKDVVRIVALDSIYFDAQLTESQYAEVQAGQSVSVAVDALPGRTFQGAVSKIFPVASSTARSFTVRVTLRNAGNALRPQMFARGQIVLATHPNAVLISRSAVLDATATTGRVFVAQSGKTALQRQVKLGLQNARDIEITSGVRAGDPVVTVGQAQLQDGATIQIDTKPATDNPAGSASAQ